MKKKIVAIILIVCVLFSFSACGNNSRKEWDKFSYYGQDAGHVEQGYTKIQLKGVYSYYIGYYDGWAYLLENEIMSRMRPNGANKQVIGLPVFVEPMIYKNWFYYQEGGFNMDSGQPTEPISRSRINGKNKKIYKNTVETVTIKSNWIVDDDNDHTVSISPFYFTGYGNWIYYLSRSDGYVTSLFRIHINGTGKKKIVENCNHFIIANGYLFATCETEDNQIGNLIRFNLNGTNSTRLKEQARPIFADSKFLYYNLYDEVTKIWTLCRMTPKGKNDIVIAENVAEVLKHRDENIYFTREYQTDNWREVTQVCSVPEDGSSDVKILFEVMNATPFISGDAVFYVAIENVSRDGRWYNLFTLWRYSLTDGSVIEVYKTELSEHALDYFVHNNKLYIITSEY